ncbi:hypothetical protein CVD28_15350 [Bacillus sp. M6-12]|uniref:hypothetical protein n=1 Tax=Bacillus sp. M6-12 TaxID=2054166 RepID=UPI000C76B148|nr:hypothetical protein [Bacillus sp. M6-12]PLS16463.1 hypothetical protein CVD28_15350 [Bacillus sp. M6-12]
MITFKGAEKVKTIGLFFYLAFGSLNFLSTEITQSSELKIILKAILPPKSELIKPEVPLDSQPIQQYDFDKDGQTEIIAVYKVPDSPNLMKAIVLKKEKEKWNKVWETTGKGFDLDRAALTDVTGDGTDELLFGWMIGASAGNEMEVFQWQGGTLKKIADLAYYHKLELIKKNNQTRFAVWQRYCCDTYLVNVLRWDGKQLVPDEETFSE